MSKRRQDSGRLCKNAGWRASTFKLCQFPNFVAACFTSPCSIPLSPAAKTGVQSGDPDGCVDMCHHSDGSTNSPALTFSPHPGHSPSFVASTSSLCAQVLKTRKLLKPRSGNSPELDRSLRRFILNTFRSIRMLIRERQAASSPELCSSLPLVILSHCHCQLHLHTSIVHSKGSESDEEGLPEHEIQ